MARQAGSSKKTLRPAKFPPPFLHTNITLTVPVEDCSQYNFDIKYTGALLDSIKLPLPPRQVRVRVGRVRGVGGAARPGGPAQLRPAPRHQRPHHQLQHPGQARLRRQG